MSLDEVLASSLWAWPDPLVKRNQAGQVMFVNAAFLQIYGGQAQEWSGRTVDGWPAPSNMGAQRFETRAGEGENQQVFDWVESIMADGNALSIARNITAFTAQIAPTPERTTTPTPQPKQPVIAEVEPVVATQPQPAQQAPAPAPVPVQAPIQEITQKPAAIVSPEPNSSSEYEQILDKKADEFAYEENRAAPAPSTQAPSPQTIDAPIADQMAMQAQVQAQEPIQKTQTAPQTQQQSAPAAPQEEQNRMIERRALPIKDSTNVLGSNWRDQVIAKAVGGSNAVEDPADMGASTPVKAVEEEPAKPGDGLQILLAEDNAINALLTRTLLEAEGAEVDTVEDGALALEAVGKKKYDLVFMDMRMPNMDGLESTRKIRAYGFDRPIIALTANAFDDDRNACFDSGMNDFMTKPVSAEELSEMVTNWAGNEATKKMTG